MRIAAVLAAIARILARHLFRPVYLPFDPAGDAAALPKLLHDLHRADPARQAHLRATLLALLPERQARSADRRVETALHEVGWLVQPLLGAVQYDAFMEGLTRVVRAAAAGWRQIQTARVVIEPYFGPPYDGAAAGDCGRKSGGERRFHWQTLPLPEMDDDRDDMTVEVGRPPGREDDDDDDDDGRAAEAAGGPVENVADILLVAWPSFCVLEEGGVLASLTPGLAVSKRQARPAMAEVRARVVLRARKARTMSVPGTSRRSGSGGAREDAAGGERKPFLGAGRAGDGGQGGSAD